METKSAQPQLPPLDEKCRMEMTRWENAICNDWSCCPKYAEVDCRERQLLSALAENESLKAQLEKWESKVSPDELSRHLDHGMNCGSKGFDGDDRGSCTCGLAYRIQVQTEQNLRTAWTKRAEEAEAERDQALEVIREYRVSKGHEGCFSLIGLVLHKTEIDDRCPTCIKADALISRETKET